MAGLLVARRGRLRPAVAAGVTDDFNRADNASSLGTSSSGALWTTHAGTVGIISNTAGWASGTTSSGSPGRASVETFLSDLTVKATIATLAGFSNLGGVLLRYVDNNNYLFARMTTTSISLGQRLAGSFTNLGNFSVSNAPGTVLEVVMAGTSITVKKDGTTVISTTNSNFTTATRHGLYTEAAAFRFDDFSAAP